MGMGSGLSMTSRAEVTARYARAYAKATKKDKGRILDSVVKVTGWSRYNARRQLSQATKSKLGLGRQAAKVLRKPRARKYSHDAPLPLLRSSITIRKADDEVESEPGFFEGDTVAHCGPTLKGEFGRRVNLTCVHTGWVFTRTVRNNAHIHVLKTLKRADGEIPFAITGLDFDNGTEFLDKAVIGWAGECVASRIPRRTPSSTSSSEPRRSTQLDLIARRYAGRPLVDLGTVLD
jgi:hypothetical protein